MQNVSDHANNNINDKWWCWRLVINSNIRDILHHFGDMKAVKTHQFVPTSVSFNALIQFEHCGILWHSWSDKN